MDKDIISMELFTRKVDAASFGGFIFSNKYVRNKSHWSKNYANYRSSTYDAHTSYKREL